MFLKEFQKIFEYRVQTCVMFESKLILLIEFINFRRITFTKKFTTKLLYIFLKISDQLPTLKRCNVKRIFCFLLQNMSE